MRLKSELWVQAYLQKLSAAMIPVFVIRRGHESAGAIFIKVNQLNGFCKIYSPASAAFSETPAQAHDDRLWTDFFPDKQLEERETDQWLREQASYDSDIWVIEVEDKTGNSHLEQQNLADL